MGLWNRAGGTLRAIISKMLVWRNLSGSAAAEYALISALLGVVLSVSLGFIGNGLEDVLQRFGSNESRAVHAGLKHQVSQPVEPPAR